MRRLLWLLAALLPSLCMAAGPNFSEGGLVIGLQYGLTSWNLDRPGLASQVGDANAALFADPVSSPTQTASLRIGYNILGHATVEADITGTGWSLSESTRGGGGFGVGVVHWHPMELFFHKKERPIPIDPSIFGGAGYGIAGSARGMDGLVFEGGLNVDYFFVKMVAVSLYARGIFLRWDKFYLNYDQRAVPGNTVALPQSSGGVLWNYGIALDFRFGT